MKKLLLLNPPGDKKYMRDYYCPKVSKARYYYHPLDLVYLSGRLAHFFDLYLIDAIAEELKGDECFEKITGINPDVIISLVSSPSYYYDIELLNKVKAKLPNTIIIGSGDIYGELKTESFKDQQFLDAILLDFSTDDIIQFLTRKSDKKINNVIYKKGKKIIEGAEVHGRGEFEIPVPRWNLFKLEKYHFPFSRKKGFVTILTDFGCPFNCSFCPMCTFGFKIRTIDNVLEEMRLLKRLGIKELFIRDQTFGVNKKRTIDLCNMMVKEKLNFSWTCFSRIDVLKEDMLKEMKNAGCHTIMFGIESGDENILKNYEKNTSLKSIKETIELVKKNKIRTVGTFILGLPGETKESIMKTIRLSIQLKLDFASFNIATPRFGTRLRKQAITKKWIDKSMRVMESTESKPIWSNQILSNEEILKLKDTAVKSFYLRPTYLLKRLCGIMSLEELKNSIIEAKSLIIKNK